mgnify:CR=1 FL=1|tara:strand:- start:1872 stop:2897 length:1026 start_codon:yes stop_codon:yes gene_type:complete
MKKLYILIILIVVLFYIIKVSKESFIDYNKPYKKYKHILGFCTNRKENFTKYSILSIKRFINEIDEFYIITTKEAYNTFFKKLLDFPHKKIFFKNEDVYPKKIGYNWYRFYDFISERSPKESLIHIGGDGGIFHMNPFKWITEKENNFYNYDIVSVIMDSPNVKTEVSIDIGPFCKNNIRSKKFIKELIKLVENLPNNLLLQKNVSKKKELTNMRDLNYWMLVQDIFWNIYINNKNLHFLTKLAKVHFLDKKYMHTQKLNSLENWCSLLYDSLLLKNVCQINLLGRNKYLIKDEIYKYYLDVISNKKKIINKEVFLKKCMNYDKIKSIEAAKHYKLLNKKN